MRLKVESISPHEPENAGGTLGLEVAKYGTNLVPSVTEGEMEVGPVDPDMRVNEP
jgi:hypothetical protein